MRAHKIERMDQRETLEHLTRLRRRLEQCQLMFGMPQTVTIESPNQIVHLNKKKVRPVCVIRLVLMGTGNGLKWNVIDSKYTFKKRTSVDGIQQVVRDLFVKIK